MSLPPPHSARAAIAGALVVALASPAPRIAAAAQRPDGAEPAASGRARLRSTADGTDAPRLVRECPGAACTMTRDEVLSRWARTWRADINEQVVFCPRWGRTVSSMTADHGSAWDYDSHIPLILHGPRHVVRGRFDDPVRPVDLFPTLSRLLGRADDPSLPGRPLVEALRSGAGPPPRVILTVVLDQVGFHALERDLDRLPALSRLAREGAWFTGCQVDYLPTITAVFHAVLATGRYPFENGISSDKILDPRTGRFRNAVQEGDPVELAVPTLMELWHEEQHRRPRVVAISQAARASVELAGHRRGEVFDRRKVALFWDPRTERWVTNRRFYRMPGAAAAIRLPEVGPLPATWMGHRIASATDRTRTPALAQLTAETVARLVRDGRVGAGDGPTDLVHVTFKETDAAGHHHGHGSPEFREMLYQVDRALARVLRALEETAGRDRLVVMVTADHGGIPDEIRSPGARVTEEEVERWLLERHPVRRGATPWLRRVINPQVYLVERGLSEHGLTPERIARTLSQHPAIFSALSAEEILSRRRATMAGPGDGVRNRAPRSSRGASARPRAW
jgi:hypothetical protein